MTQVLNQAPRCSLNPGYLGNPRAQTWPIAVGMRRRTLRDQQLPYQRSLRKHAHELIHSASVLLGNAIFVLHSRSFPRRITSYIAVYVSIYVLREPGKFSSKVVQGMTSNNGIAQKVELLVRGRLPFVRLGAALGRGQSAGLTAGGASTSANASTSNGTHSAQSATMPISA